MKSYLLVFFVLSVFLTIYCVFHYFRVKEGFQNAREPVPVEEEEEEEEEEGKEETKADRKTDGEPNALTSLFNNVKRINGYLMDPTLWSDRIEMFRLSPVDLARRELKRQLATNT